MYLIKIQQATLKLKGLYKVTYGTGNKTYIGRNIAVATA